MNLISDKELLENVENIRTFETPSCSKHPTRLTRGENAVFITPQGAQLSPIHPYFLMQRGRNIMGHMIKTGENRLAIGLSFNNPKCCSRFIPLLSLHKMLIIWGFGQIV